MAAGGLTKFIHGTQQGTKANPRKIPQKLILDDANQVYKYSSAEPSETSTRRGVFSTDLGSYPDTSIEDIQDHLGGSGRSPSVTNLSERHERPLMFQDSGSLIENGTGVSTQKRASNNRTNQVESSPPLIGQDATVSALIGAGNLQEYEQFLQTWTANGDPSEKLLENASQVPLAPTHQLPSLFPQTAVPAASHNTSSIQAFTQKPSQSTLAQRYQPNGKDNATQKDRPREASFRPLRRLPATTIFQSQVAPQTEEPNDQPSATALNSVEQGTIRQDPLPSNQHAISVQPSHQQPISGQWSLKRTANLDSVKLDLSDQQLLSMQYSSLDEKDERPGKNDRAAFFADLDQVITDIVNQISDENALLSRLSQLGQDEWATLGDKIQSKQGESVNELKQLYAKKQDISRLYQQESQDMMKRIENNDRIVTTKLQRLRSLGAQILNDKGAIERG
ncbi:MAG: hypothetical protein GOMPHAMPRED_001479 [Gomphillus americanus]|uniref:Extracellular mutant protein 11 C-terminal domain-containing protein n=1 Tax=Gomphillus americanus TaxID=1940652 RepID=A0A8H3F4D5_9LECA|nr:MAG: hypothetical protein GOMPHAMPRED_001479 [Gomphillus americanus]